VRLVQNKWFGDRGKRLSELLAADESVTFEEMLAFATDTLVWEARQWMPHILEAYEKLGEKLSSPGSYLDEAVNLLKTWDFRCEADSNAMALFQLFYSKASLNRMNPDSAFTEDDLIKLLEFVDAAASELKKNFGRMDIPWGKIHYLKHGGKEYPLSGGSSSLEAIRACFAIDEGGRLRVVGGSSYHMVVELSPTLRALSCFALSASENPKSFHYSDITELYARKKYKPVCYTWRDLSQHIESDITLAVPQVR